uniref:Uncharacterized protein n=1 Tax=Opuntia streptacantha TaxID=393608 RepID=A0A7C9CLQ3_OPUST
MVAGRSPQQDPHFLTVHGMKEISHKWLGSSSCTSQLASLTKLGVFQHPILSQHLATRVQPYLLPLAQLQYLQQSIGLKRVWNSVEMKILRMKLNELRRKIQSNSHCRCTTLLSALSELPAYSSSKSFRILWV